MTHPGLPSSGWPLSLTQSSLILTNYIPDWQKVGNCRSFFGTGGENTHPSNRNWQYWTWWYTVCMNQRSKIGDDIKCGQTMVKTHHQLIILCFQTVLKKILQKCTKLKRCSQCTSLIILSFTYHAIPNLYDFSLQNTTGNIFMHYDKKGNIMICDEGDSLYYGVSLLLQWSTKSSTKACTYSACTGKSIEKWSWSK